MENKKINHGFYAITEFDYDLSMEQQLLHFLNYTPSKNINNLLSGNIIKISEGKAIIIASYESQTSAEEVSTQIKEVLGQLKQFVSSEFNRSTGSVFWNFSSDDTSDANFYAVTHFKYKNEKQMIESMNSKNKELNNIDGLLFVRSIKISEGNCITIAGYKSSTHALKAKETISTILSSLAEYFTAKPDRNLGSIIWSVNQQKTTEEKNIQLIKSLVEKFINGDGAGYIAGCHPEFSGSILPGLIEGGHKITNLEQLGKMFSEIPNYIEIKKFEPVNWAAVGDTVYFTVNWEFIWLKNGKNVKTSANVRKVIKDGKIYQKYHLINNLDVLN